MPYTIITEKSNMITVTRYFVHPTLVTECIKESELESEVTRFGVGGA